MMNRTSLARSAICAWLLLTVAPVVYAGPGYPSTGQETYLSEMKHLDANGDGTIDPQELATGQQLAAMILTLSWNQSDLNQDGVLTEGEFLAAAEAAMQEVLSTQGEEDSQAEQALAEAIPLSVLLENLARDDQYAEEIAALR